MPTPLGQAPLNTPKGLSQSINQGLDPNSFWMIGSALFMTFNGVFLREVIAELTIYEAAMWRSLLVALVAALYALFRRQSFKTPVPGLQALRSFFGVCSILSWYYVLTNMPMATAATLYYTAPIWVALCLTLMALRRGAVVPWRFLVPILCGFAGVLLIYQPEIEEGKELIMAIGIAMGFTAASASLSIRAMASWSEPVWRTVFYFSCSVSLVACVLQLGVYGGFSAVSLRTGAFLVSLGVCGGLMQLCYTRAFCANQILLTAVFEYGTIVLMAVTGYWIYGEVSGWVEWLGIATIMVSGIVTTVLMRHQKNGAASEPADGIQGKRADSL